MNEELVRTIAENFQSKTTDDLIAIWHEEDRDQYSDEAFEAVRRILAERGHLFAAKATGADKEAKMGTEATEAKPHNNYAIASLAIAIVNFPVLLADSTAGWLLRGGVGILALVLGIVAIAKAKALRSGRRLAIAGIMMASLSAITILKPALGAARESAHRAAAHRLVGKPTPAFALTGEDGATVTDASLRGSVYILDFWTTPQSSPQLDTLRLKHKEKGLKVFAVHNGNRVAPAHPAVPVRPGLLDYSDLYETGWNIAGGAFYATPANPEMVLVGRDGLVLGVFDGSRGAGEIEDRVSAALAAR